MSFRLGHFCCFTPFWLYALTLMMITFSVDRLVKLPCNHWTWPMCVKVKPFVLVVSAIIPGSTLASCVVVSSCLVHMPAVHQLYLHTSICIPHAKSVNWYQIPYFLIIFPAIFCSFERFLCGTALSQPRFFCCLWLKSVNACMPSLILLPLGLGAAGVAMLC